MKDTHTHTHTHTHTTVVECTEATVDSLDAYMKSVGDQLDGTKKLEIKHSLHDLKKVQYGNIATFCQSSMRFVRRKLVR